MTTKTTNPFIAAACDQAGEECELVQKEAEPMTTETDGLRALEADGQFSKGCTTAEANAFTAYGIHHAQPDGSIWYDQIQVYGDESLRDRILSALTAPSVGALEWREGRAYLNGIPIGKVETNSCNDDGDELWSYWIGYREWHDVDDRKKFNTKVEASAALETAVREVLRAPTSKSEWQPIDRNPTVKRGDMDTFIIAMRRAHNGAVYTFPARYLNAVMLWSEHEQKDIAYTGWYSAQIHEDQHWLFISLLEPNTKDELVAWCEIPEYTPSPKPDVTGKLVEALEPFAEIAKSEIRDHEDNATKIPVRIGFIRRLAKAVSPDFLAENAKKGGG